LDSEGKYGDNEEVDFEGGIGDTIEKKICC
jgi:hypothetical protein